jgi:hypothetical protein
VWSRAGVAGEPQDLVWVIAMQKSRDSLFFRERDEFGGHMFIEKMVPRGLDPHLACLGVVHPRLSIWYIGGVRDVTSTSASQPTDWPSHRA